MTDKKWLSGASEIGTYIGITYSGAIRKLVIEHGLPAKKLFGVWRALPDRKSVV